MNPHLFPRVKEWAEELENGNRGDGIKFSQWADYLVAAGYTRIADIEGLTVTEIKDECPGIASGVASKLIRYAKADATSIREQEKRRMRQERNQPRFYE